MKFNIKRLILILMPLLVLPFFQNCQKSQTKEQASSGNCINSSEGPCGLTVKDGEKINVSLSNSELYFNSPMYQGDFNYKISIAGDIITNSLNSKTCGLTNNLNWQSMKSNYLSNGICSYTFNVPANYARCMAMVIPIGYIKDLTTNSETNLSTSICQNDFYNICGQENMDKFLSNLLALTTQLEADQGCDP